MCGILVVLVCILAPVSVLAVWLHSTVLDTDQYVATVAPLAHKPAVQEAIATRVTNALVASTDLEFLRTALRSVFVLGVIAAIGAWLSGPGETATKIRDSAVGLFRRRGRAPEAHPSALAAFVSRYRGPLRVFVAAVGLVILVVLSHPGPNASGWPPRACQPCAQSGHNA